MGNGIKATLNALEVLGTMNVTSGSGKRCRKEST